MALLNPTAQVALKMGIHHAIHFCAFLAAFVLVSHEYAVTIGSMYLLFTFIGILILHNYWDRFLYRVMWCVISALAIVSFALLAHHILDGAFEFRFLQAFADDIVLVGGCLIAHSALSAAVERFILNPHDRQGKE